MSHWFWGFTDQLLTNAKITLHLEVPKPKSDSMQDKKRKGYLQIPMINVILRCPVCLVFCACAWPSPWRSLSSFVFLQLGVTRDFYYQVTPIHGPWFDQRCKFQFARQLPTPGFLGSANRPIQIGLLRRVQLYSQYKQIFSLSIKLILHNLNIGCIVLWPLTLSRF